jgi:glycosyltransferase involved in cell wall biosynthesis
MTSRTPRIAVVLPVYNGEKYIEEAIQSVLDQTFADFVLFVIDDGSTDRTVEMLSSFTDARLRIIRFPVHRGRVPALNTGISESRSEFIARMDADDICMPQRFERQVRFLEAHPEVSICGTWMAEFGAGDGRFRPPTEAEQVRAGLFFGWVMSHPTMMMRRSSLEQFGLAYNEGFGDVEDLEFLISASEVTRLANIPEFLLHYRRHDRQVSAVYRQRDREVVGNLLVRQLRFLLPEVRDEEEAFHVNLANGTLPPSRLRQAEDWLLRLDRANREKAKYNIEYFRSGLSQWWFKAHTMQAVSGGVGVLKSYWSSPLASMQGIGLFKHAAMAIKCIIRKRPNPLRWNTCRHFVRRLQRGTARREPWI